MVSFQIYEYDLHIIMSEGAIRCDSAFCGILVKIHGEFKSEIHVFVIK